MAGLQFNQPEELTHKEVVSNLYLTAENQVATEPLGLFDAAEPLPQQAPDEVTATAWLPWAIGSVATLLVAGLLVYLIPALSNVAEE